MDFKSLMKLHKRLSISFFSVVCNLISATSDNDWQEKPKRTFPHNSHGVMLLSFLTPHPQ